MTTVQCYEKELLLDKSAGMNFPVFLSKQSETIDNHCFRTCLHMIIVSVF